MSHRLILLVDGQRPRRGNGLKRRWVKEIHCLTIISETNTYIQRKTEIAGAGGQHGGERDR